MSKRKMNFVGVHTLLSYIKDLISLNAKNFYIVHYNGPLVPKWRPMWFNEIVRWRNLVLLETMLVPSHEVLVILIVNINMSCINILSLTHHLSMDGKLEVHPVRKKKTLKSMTWCIKLLKLAIFFNKVSIHFYLSFFYALCLIRILTYIFCIVHDLGTLRVVQKIQVTSSLQINDLSTTGSWV